MDVELRHLRCLAGVVDAGTFTDAAIDLGLSQAAVSRNVAALELALGVRLLHRTTRCVEPTDAGIRVLRQARRALSAVADLRREAAGGGRPVRIGYAWSALGRHTPDFQRSWAESFPYTELQLMRMNTATAGLVEGSSDMAILRRVPDDVSGLNLTRIGDERRCCAMAADHPLAARRSVVLAHIAAVPLAIDLRTGSTRLDLWPANGQPLRTIPTNDVDDWLTVIGSGKAVGITAESTAHQYRRKGIVYRPVRDVPPVPVYAVWNTDDPLPSYQQIIELLTRIYR